MSVIYKTTGDDGSNINVEIAGFFKVDELKKEYAMFSIVDDNPNNEMGSIMLGEVIREGDNVKILDIKDDEVDLVVAMYNEISNQVGGE